MVTRPQIGDRITHCLDHTRRLVSQHQRAAGHRHVAGHHVQVGVTQSARHRAYQHLVVSRQADTHLTGLDGTGRTVQYGRSHRLVPHSCIASSWVYL